MEDHVDSTLLGELSSYAPASRERATLTRRSPSAHRTSSERCTPPKHPSSPGESSAFWALIGIMLLLAAGNLSVTFFAMGVLRLGTGMESLEFLPGSKITKFFGIADLANIQKKDGILYGYSDVPFKITAQDSKVSLSLRTKNDPPLLDISPQRTEFRKIDEFKVFDPISGEKIFSTKHPNFGLPRKVINLSVKRTRTSRVVSPTFSDLEVNSDSTIRLKGNEGITLNGKKLAFSANQDVYFKTLNGSIVLDGRGSGGIFVEVHTLPYADGADAANGRGQYKLCVCLPMGQLFRIPVPFDNNKRSLAKQINCSSFTNTCKKF